MKSLKKYIDILFELGKVRITFFVAVTTSVGFLLYKGHIDQYIILPTIGVFLLACGSSALNHFQEKDKDALMDRTKGRPIPSGRIKPQGALIIAFVLIVISSLIIFYSANVTALILGWINLFWYNVIYTPLKRINSLAVIPGSVIGALPPVIGWTAAGGSLFDPKILAVALFFFIWQIPHFWLLLMIYGKDYEQAGFPTLTKIFSNRQLSRITFTWIAALATSCLLIPLFDVSSSIISIVLIIALGFVLVWKTKNILTNYIEKIIFRKAFLQINLYVLAIVLILSLEKLLLQEF